MALSNEQLKELAAEMVAALFPEKTEVLLTTGEEFQNGELDVARAMKRATGLQRSAVFAMVASWEQTP
jgi:hypothetical protein